MKKLRTKVLTLAAILLLTGGSVSMLEHSIVTQSTAVTASAEPSTALSGKCGSSISWVIKDGVLTLSGSGDMYNYKSNEESPFAERNDITKIVVQNGITSIGDYAFYNCKKAGSFTLPTSLKKIGSYSMAFSHSIGSLTIPEGVTSLGDHALYWSRDLKTVKLPSTLKTIGSNCFSRCSELENVSLPNGFEELHDHAFAYTSIKKINFPETMTRLGEYALYACDIESVTIPGSIKRVGDVAFGSCRQLKKVIVKEGVLKLGGGCFNGCEKISSVSLPDSLLFIGGACFHNCQQLKSITIPPKVNTLGNGVFENCKSLNSVTVPDTVTSMGNNVFANCESLKSVILPKDLEDLGTGLFRGCKELESVKMPQKLKTIGSQAFYHCDKLPLTALPETVTEIGSSAFAYCKNIKSLSIPKGVKNISWGLFSNCSGLESVKLPNGITQISAYAFEACRDLSSIDLPSGITSIGDGAFSYCEKLKKIAVPDAAVVLGSFAFGKCTELSYVRLSKKLTTIGQEAFCDCPKLKSIVVPKSVTKIDNQALGYLYNDTLKRIEGFTIKCLPGSAAESYAKANGFSYELITYAAAKKPTCTAAGNNAHWICQGKYYADELLTVQTTKDKVTLKAAGHKWSAWKTQTNATVNKNGTKTRSCSVCLAKEFAATAKAVKRLSGANRYTTAVEISKAAFTQAADVILASGLNYADALAGVPLAAKLNAPILLTSKDSLPSQTLAEIKRLKASRVIILGGKNAVSEAVEKQLLSSKLKTERVSGNTRYGTATAIAQRLSSRPSEIFFVYGLNYADALSVSTVAAAKNAPIIYLKTNGSIDNETAKYLSGLKKNGCVKTAYVIGGKSVISESMRSKAAAAVGLKTAERVSGNNRFLTCTAVNTKFKNVLSGNGICVATGTDFPDALSGGVLAAKNRTPLFLINSKASKPDLLSGQTAYLKDKKAGSMVIFGGTTAVPDSHIKTISKLCI